LNRPVLLDTGPLVAVMNRRDQFHAWAQQEMAMLQPPLLTCEAVLVEAWFLLGRVPNGRSSFLRFLNQSELRIGIQFAQEKDRLLELMQRYSSVPMSVADACLVHLSEKFPTGVVLTLDSDFLIYRRFDRESIPTIMPPPS